MPSLDERIEALVHTAELLLAESKEHSKQLEQDGEHIRGLARIAELHHQRLQRLEEERL